MSIGVVLWVTVTGRVAKRLFNWAHPTANPVRSNPSSDHAPFWLCTARFLLACAIVRTVVFSNVAVLSVILCGASRGWTMPQYAGLSSGFDCV